MAMEPQLKAMLSESVQFRPLQAKDPHGQASFGALTAPVKGRFEFERGRRMQQNRDESTYKSGRVFLDAPDFDPDLVKVGSKVLIPDATERVVSVVKSYAHAGDDFSGQTGVHHWVITWV